MTNAPLPQSELDAARQYLEQLQQDAHETLGREKKIGIDLPIEFSYDISRKAFPHLEHNKDLESFRIFMDEITREARALCPSRLEDPTVYALISALVKKAYAALDILGLERHSEPLFGTLPTGRVNGMAIAVPGSSTRIIVIEHGLFGFANLMCKAVAMAIPLKDVNDDNITFNVNPADVSAHLERNPEAIERFFDALAAYVIGGDPHEAEQYNPHHSLAVLSSILRDSMELFIVGHELGHVFSGHLDRKAVHCALPSGLETHEISPEWVQELEADLVGMLVATQAQVSIGLDLSMSYLGADLFFGCIDVVEKAVSLLATGKVSALHSDSHPPSMARRHALRIWLEKSVGEQNEEAAKTAVELAVTVTTIIEFFWARVEPAFLKMHQSGVRPAPMWYGLVEEAA